MNQRVILILEAFFYGFPGKFFIQQGLALDKTTAAFCGIVDDGLDFFFHLRERMKIRIAFTVAQAQDLQLVRGIGWRRR